MRPMLVHSIQAVDAQNSPFVEAVEGEGIVMLKASLTLQVAFEYGIDFEAGGEFVFVSGQFLQQ